MVMNELIESEIILPSQFFIQQRSVSEPEHRLMRAVLEDAIDCFRKGKVGESKRKWCLSREAEEWFRSTDTKWLYSFENICQHLGLDADSIRNALFCGNGQLVVSRIRHTASPKSMPLSTCFK